MSIKITLSVSTVYFHQLDMSIKIALSLSTVYYIKLKATLYRKKTSFVTAWNIMNRCVNEWVIVVKPQFSNFSAISWREQVNFQWDDDEVRFVLDQHAELDFYSSSSLKQQSAGDMSLHSDTLFWFRANQSLLFLLNAACLAEKQQAPILYSLSFDPTGARTHNRGEQPHHCATDAIVSMTCRLILQYFDYETYMMNVIPEICCAH